MVTYKEIALNVASFPYAMPSLLSFMESKKYAVINGTLANDNLIGTSAYDTINNDAGDDLLEGRGGNDDLSGSEGADLLYGNAGDDSLIGDPVLGSSEYDYALTLNCEGDDSLEGGSGKDVLEGGAGKDNLSGGEGDDILYGGYPAMSQTDCFNRCPHP